MKIHHPVLWYSNHIKVIRGSAFYHKILFISMNIIHWDCCLSDAKNEDEIFENPSKMRKTKLRHLWKQDDSIISSYDKNSLCQDSVKPLLSHFSCYSPFDWHHPGLSSLINTFLYFSFIFNSQRALQNIQNGFWRHFWHELPVNKNLLCS